MKKETIESTIVAVKKDQTIIQKQAQAIRVTSDKQMGVASEFLVQIKARIKRIETKRKDYVQPLNDQVTKMNADFKEMAQPYLEIEETIKGKVGSYMTKVREKEEEAQRKADEERRKEAEALAKKEKISKRKAMAQVEKVEIEQRDQTVRTETSKVVTKQVTKFEVINPKKVPDEYKMVDERLVRKAVNQGIKIPGVKVWEETQVSTY